MPAGVAFETNPEGAAFTPLLTERAQPNQAVTDEESVC
jgi:hypothetical protein